MGESDRSLVLPREGSNVGPKDPAFSDQMGSNKRSCDGKRVETALSNGAEAEDGESQQIDVLEDVEEGSGNRSSLLDRRRPGPFGNELLVKADEMFDKADKTGDGRVSREEFKHYMNRQTLHSSKMIDDYFDAVDADGNGFIDREEARNAFLGKRDAALDAQRRNDSTRGVGGLRRRSSLGEIFNDEEDEMEDMENDVYNMFFIANAGSASFGFAIFVFLVKVGLMVIIAIDVVQTGFPDEDVGPLVKILQFILLFVNVSFQEELIATFFVYANLKWSRHVLEIHPSATKVKYHCANIMRFLDGICFLFINTTVLCQATAPLGAMLNFAALMFLSQIDNQALTLAREGYLLESMEAVAGDVQQLKMPRNHNSCLQKMDTEMLLLVLLAEFVTWLVLVIL